MTISPTVTATEAGIAEDLTERLDEVLRPYRHRDEPGGFVEIVEAEVEEILAMPLSRREMARSIAAYRRKADDQLAIAQIIAEALAASEDFRRGGGALAALAPAISQSSAEIEHERSGKRPGGRTNRELLRARRILGEIYPNGLPDDISTAALTRRVNAECVKQQLDTVSRDTVYRARSSEKD